MAGTCVVLIRKTLGDHEIDHKDLQNWFTASMYEEWILHVEELTEIDVSEGTLTAAPFQIPPEIDIKDIGAIGIADSESGDTLLEYGFQCPPKGIRCFNEANLLCLTGVCSNPRSEETNGDYSTDCDILEDPCALAKELWCCVHNLRKNRQKVSIRYRERSVTYQPYSEQDKQELTRMAIEAQAACDKLCGKESTYRGGRLGHSCRGCVSRRYGGGCSCG